MTAAYAKYFCQKNMLIIPLQFHYSCLPALYTFLHLFRTKVGVSGVTGPNKHSKKIGNYQASTHTNGGHFGGNIFRCSLIGKVAFSAQS